MILANLITKSGQHPLPGRGSRFGTTGGLQHSANAHPVTMTVVVRFAPFNPPFHAAGDTP